MEVAMELSKKTTILLSDELHSRLSALAAREGVSLGELIRDACRRQYGLFDRTERLAAVDALGALAAPVADVRTMKRQSVPGPDEL